MQRDQTGPIMFECGGPRVYSYEELLRAVANAAGIKPRLFPVPFAAWGGDWWIRQHFRDPSQCGADVRLSFRVVYLMI